jgi:predicted site-specific integrase-resolvase
MDGEEGDGERYISSANIRSTFGVSNTTLRNWAEKGEVGVVRFGANGKRLYSRRDIVRAFRGYVPRSAEGKKAAEGRRRRSICYARVSSPKQRDDLERQIQDLKEAYPGSEIVRDVASGINWKRSGLLSILDGAMRGDVGEVIVTHRDRLCRFAFELVKHVLERSKCKIVVLSQDDIDGGGWGEESELRDDLLAIVTVFVASNNGKRSARNRRARKAILDGKKEGRSGPGDGEEEEEEMRDEEGGEPGPDEMHEAGTPPHEGAEGDPDVVA